MGHPFNAPFTASWTVSSKRADGTTVSDVTLETVARDSSGRIYLRTDRRTADGQVKQSSLTFSVDDPVKHVSFDWSNESRVVHLHRLLDPNTPEYKDALLKAPHWVAEIWAHPLCFAWDPTGQFEGGSYKKELLGTKTILGLPAEGIRATRWLPAGYKGYDHPVTVTEERWYSADLQLALLNTVDDPRVGKGMRELTSLERTEPSPELFHLPTGYTIRESADQTLTMRPESPEKSTLR
jgi:hypothetical protein